MHNDDGLKEFIAFSEERSAMGSSSKQEPTMAKAFQTLYSLSSNAMYDVQDEYLTVL